MSDNWAQVISIGIVSFTTLVAFAMMSKKKNDDE